MLIGVGEKVPTTEFLVGAVRTVVLAVAQLFSRQADRIVLGAYVVREFTQQCLAIIFIRVILTVAVSITHPRLTDTPRYRKRKREREREIECVGEKNHESEVLYFLNQQRNILCKSNSKYVFNTH